jgi:hypothetical protein
MTSTAEPLLAGDFLYCHIKQGLTQVKLELHATMQTNTAFRPPHRHRCAHLHRSPPTDCPPKLTLVYPNRCRLACSRWVDDCLICYAHVHICSVCVSSADEWRIVCGQVADRPQTSGGSSADRISARMKWIVSVCISTPAEIQTEIYYFSCTGMSSKSWVFSAHFSTPEMLGFGRTFFRTDTLSFRLQFRRVCFAIQLLRFQLHFSLSKTQFYSCTLDYDFRCN